MYLCIYLGLYLYLPWYVSLFTMACIFVYTLACILIYFGMYLCIYLGMYLCVYLGMYLCLPWQVSLSSSPPAHIIIFSILRKVDISWARNGKEGEIASSTSALVTFIGTILQIACLILKF